MRPPNRESTVQPPASAPAPPAAGAHLDQAAGRRAVRRDRIDAASFRPARRDGPAGADHDREAGRHALAQGSTEPGRAAGAAAEGSTADWQSLYAEAHRLQLAGNLVAAVDAYRRAVELNPHHPAMHYDLGYVLQMQGQVAAAIDHYRRAVALQPDHGYAHYNLGYLLQAQGDSAAAIEHYEIAAARLPGNAYVYYDWAWSLELSGDRTGAAALYRKAIALDPQHRPGIDARRRLAALGESARLE